MLGKSSSLISATGNFNEVGHASLCYFTGIELSGGIYNVYNRNKPFFLFWDRNEEGKYKLYQVPIFPIMPNISVAYNFK